MMEGFMASTASDGASGASSQRDPQGRGASALRDRVIGQTGKLADFGVAKVVQLADSRKDEAVEKLDGVVEVIGNFADAAEEKFGEAAGHAVRRGSDAVETAARALRDRSVTDIALEARSTIVRHPAAAIGAVSVFAFVAGRIVKASLSQASAPKRAKRVEAAA
jgi:hypothetical protein